MTYYENFGSNSFDKINSPQGKPFGRVTELIEHRVLELRSGLFFHYPTLISDSYSKNRNMLVFMPFYENPTINESNVAKLAEYNPINRNGSLYAHTGAKSRKISLSFSLSLPHIHQSLKSVADFLQSNKKKLNIDDIKHKFRTINTLGSLIEKDEYGRYEDSKTKDSDAYNLWKSAWDSLHGDALDSKNNRFRTKEEQETITSFESNEEDQFAASLLGANDIIGGAPLNEYVDPRIRTNRRSQQRIDLAKQIKEMPEKYKNVITSINFFVDVIRTCVLNNSTTTVQGPPLIRIRYGTLYEDIPCIAKGYKISYDENAGMDLKTLMPNKIKVSLDLAEYRAGNFGEFNPGKRTERDNLYGWESVILKGHGVDSKSLEPQGKK